MLQVGIIKKQSWMGLSLLRVRSSSTILISTDICLTCSGTAQPSRPFILVLHYSLSPWHTRQEVLKSQLGRVRSDIKRSILTEKPDSFLSAVVFYDFMDWYVSVFSRLSIPVCLVFSLRSHFPELTAILCTFFLEHIVSVVSRTKCSILLQLQFYHLEV